MGSFSSIRCNPSPLSRAPALAPGDRTRGRRSRTADRTHEVHAFSVHEGAVWAHENFICQSTARYTDGEIYALLVRQRTVILISQISSRELRVQQIFCISLKLKKSPALQTHSASIWDEWVCFELVWMGKVESEGWRGLLLGGGGS